MQLLEIRDKFPTKMPPRSCGPDTIALVSEYTLAIKQDNANA